jgi:hypothetical protein
LQFLRDACEDIKARRQRIAERTFTVGTALQSDPDDYVTLEKIITRHPSLLAMSVERKLRPTLTFLRLHYPDCTLPTAMKLCTFSLGGNIIPRVRMMQKYEAACDEGNQRDRWSVATVMGVNIDKFCRKVGVSRAEYDAEVAACKAELQKELAAIDAAAAGKQSAGKAPPRTSKESAMRARSFVPAGTDADERRAARRKKREDEPTARNAAKPGVDENEELSL